eukprot:Gregarina_sp_Pseudo_9__1290@NODE_185_length_3754_cov_15_688829_g170_i0_p1_GENE_NODE_185_length_3754_cov_15_688829_g170_i0NODE_185_length_3754_cov_15_688829_g170_i0_p1_ORF_typecomplete_len335_score93_98HAUS5/PF14817_6/0_0081Wbp11/PF09429_10/2_9_NODE_185_length_3754_cov_15_688829_g170_i015402544
MVKEQNPVLASHKARKQKEREKQRREKLESKTLKQAQVDGSGVKQKLEDEIKKIRNMRGPKGRRRKLPAHMQVKLNQLEALSKQVKQQEVSTSKTNIELSHRHAVFEKAERINEGLTDDEDEGDEGALEAGFDPVHATLTDKARAGVLDIEALKEERKRRGEHVRWYKHDTVPKSSFEFGVNEEDEDDDDDDGNEANGETLSRRPPRNATETKAAEPEPDSDAASSSSGSEISDSDLALLPPPPPVAAPARPAFEARVPPPPPVHIPTGPISYVGFSDPLPPPPLFPEAVAAPVSKPVYTAEPVGAPQPTQAPQPTHPKWLVPTSVAARGIKHG